MQIMSELMPGEDQSPSLYCSARHGSVSLPLRSFGRCSGALVCTENPDSDVLVMEAATIVADGMRFCYVIKPDEVSVHAEA
jgi:hypothetical protein